MGLSTEQSFRIKKKREGSIIYFPVSVAKRSYKTECFCRLNTSLGPSHFFFDLKVLSLFPGEFTLGNKFPASLRDKMLLWHFGASSYYEYQSVIFLDIIIIPSGVSMILTRYCSKSKENKSGKVKGQGEGVRIAVLDGMARPLEQVLLS